ncbi:T9SS type A sorting domain-containing protein [Hymenobacter sediminis]|uniref:T9SS type A sorting domain-containing protein n=1 Tax=Hymenobacter sediminis TaxID=2218621 RepID=UPI0013904AC2|nr:T9SS type A sorting domain-containing protein [Hymenobacter sediminis]
MRKLVPYLLAFIVSVCCVGLHFGQAQNLVKVGEVTTPASPTGIARKGNTLYLANFGLNTLEALDISNPITPVSRSVVANSGGRARRVVVGGNTAYVANYGVGTSCCSSITAFGLQTPNNPAAPSIVNITGNPLTIGASEVAVCAVTTNNSTHTNNLQVFTPDLTPAATVELQAVGGPIRPVVQGPLAYVQDGSALKVFDVSNPRQPALRHTSTTTSISAISGATGYGTKNGGVQVYDLSTPEEPVLLSSLQLSAGAGSALLAAGPGVVYVLYTGTGSTTTSTLHVVDTSNPAAPVLRGTVSITEICYDLVATDGYAYVLVDGRFLQVYRYQNANSASITALTPDNGSVGTSVSITGTGFTGATAVRFNGVAASSFTVASATTITAVVPVGATTGPVSVTTPNGTATSPTNFTVTVAAIANNSISGPTPSEFCGSDNPGIITGQQPTGGDGTFTYQWQSSPDNITFTPVIGATGQSYDPPVISQTTHYRRLVTSAGQVATSNTVTLAVQTAVAGNTLVAPVPAVFTAAADPGIIIGSQPTGGSNSYSYQWQSSLNNTTFSSINGATEQSYDPPVLSQTTYYRRLVTSGACQQLNISNSVVIAIQLVTATQAVEAATHLVLYPNPAHQSFQLALPSGSAAKALRVEVRNALGQVVINCNKAVKHSDLSAEVDIRRLVAGVYSVQVEVNGQHFTKRLVKE